MAPGSRILVAGNGSLNLQVAAEFLRAGIEVAALVEAALVARIDAAGGQLRHRRILT